MSTKGNIGIFNKDGSIDAIYLNFDAYPEGAGITLYNFYKDTDTVKKLLSLGSLSSLGTTPESDIRFWTDEKHFDDDTKCQAYKDRPDEDCEYEVTNFRNLHYWLECLSNSYVEYAYLWDPENNEWFEADAFDGWCGLTELADVLENGKEEWNK